MSNAFSEFIDGVEFRERADQSSAAFAVEVADSVFTGKRVEKPGERVVMEGGK